jgi:hypothetical protein
MIDIGGAYALSINAAGQVVGNSPGVDAFLYSGGIRQALQDYVTRYWLLAINSYDLIKGLPNQLQQAARAMGKNFPLDKSQASIYSRMKGAALNEMVHVVAPSGANVPWTDVAEIVNLMVSAVNETMVSAVNEMVQNEMVKTVPPLGTEIPYVIAKDLHAEYSRLHRRSKK